MDKLDPIEPPPIYNINRWWNPKELNFLCKLMSAIESIDSITNIEKNLLLLSFCLVMIRISNASFKHQSMSFKDKDGKTNIQTQLFQKDFISMFKEDLHFILHSCQKNPTGKVKIIEGDSMPSISVKPYLFFFINLV